MGGTDEKRYDPVFDRAAQPRRPGTRLVLLAGFGGVLALMALIGLDSLRALQLIQADNLQISQDFLSRTHALERIRSSLYFSGSVLRQFLLEPKPRAAEEYLGNLRQLRQETESALKTYAGLLSPNEKALYSQLEARWGEYWTAVEPSLKWSAEERTQRAYSFLEGEVFSRRLAMLEIADRIGAVNEQELKARDREITALFQRYRTRLGLLLAFTLGLGVILAALTIRHILGLEADARLRYSEIARAQDELKSLSARLVNAQEQERRSISRELHDEVGQSLSALLVDIGNLTAVTSPDDMEVRRLLSAAKELAESSLSAVRNMSLLLRPSMLDDFGLVPALHWQAREVSRRTGLRVTVAADDVSAELPEEHNTCIYRVVQEALHNCARHAGANSVRVSVLEEPGRLLVSVHDDGRGFDAQRTRGLGLVGMEERVKHLDGIFQVRSRPGQGTELRVELPLVRRDLTVGQATA